MPKNFPPKHTTLLWQKLLRLQRTFLEKPFGRGLGRTAPTNNTYKKARRCRAFYFFHKQLELRSKPCFKALLKKHLKNPQNFHTETHYFTLAKAFEIPKSGFGGGQPQLTIHTKKHGVAVLFILTLLNLRIFANGIFYHFKHTHSTLFHECARKRSAFDRRNDAFDIAP